MARKSDQRASQGSSIWAPLEAEQIEVEDYMSRFMAARLLSELAIEPDWVRDALQAAWPRVLAEADAAIC